MTPPRPTLLERAGAVLVTAAVVGLAFGVSFVHTRDAMIRFGQPAVLSWPLAALPDLLATLAGLRLRWAKRTEADRVPPIVVLVVAALSTLAAQVVTAQNSVGGYIAAVFPAACFLLVLWLLEATPLTAALPAAATAPRLRRQAPASVAAAAVRPQEPTRDVLGPHAAVQQPPGAGRPVLVRAEVLAGLVDEIREAGEGWRPDYPALLASTGMSRTWAERVVREAKTAATAADGSAGVTEEAAA